MTEMKGVVKNDENIQILALGAIMKKLRLSK
jgi:hypothetical protein